MRLDHVHVVVVGIFTPVVSAHLSHTNTPSSWISVCTHSLELSPSQYTQGNKLGKRLNEATR
jgi:hypothetical protein